MRQSTTGTEDPEPKFDQAVMGLIAICVLTLACFIHFFSSRLGMLLNRYLAWLKVGFLMAIIIAGVYAGLARKQDDRRYQKGHAREHLRRIDAVAALISIIYSYRGWQNAFYVMSPPHGAPNTHGKCIRHMTNTQPPRPIITNISVPLYRPLHVY